MTDQRDRDSEESSGDEVGSSYDAWLNEKVAASLASTRPNIPHSEVERRMAERIRSLQVTGKAELKKGGGRSVAAETDPPFRCRFHDGGWSCFCCRQGA